MDGKGQTPWRRTQGQDVKGKMVPFGCKVYFKSSTDMARKSKIEDPAVGEVCARYEMKLAYWRSGGHLIWRLEDFVVVDVRRHSHAASRRQLVPFIVR